MKSFLKENIALAAGIALPLLLIALFLIAGRVTVTTVADPEYAVLFVTDYYPRNVNTPHRIDFDDGKLVISYKEKEEKLPYDSVPELYVFDFAKGTAEKLPIDMENIVDGKVSDPDLDSLNKKNLLRDSTSPDGYRFEYRHNSYNSGLFGELFGHGHYRDARYALTKDGRAVPVTGPKMYYNAEFLAWVKIDE